MKRLPDDLPEKEGEEPLPELYRLAIEALPHDMVHIMFDGLDKGKTREEIDADIDAAKSRQLESN